MSPVPQHLHPLQRLIRIGTATEMSYQERRRIIVLNIAGLSGGLCSLVFLIANLLSHYTLLCWLDLLTLLGGWSVPLFHYYGKYRYPPLLVSTLFSLCCTVSTLFYHNHTEYFLLLFLGVNFIIWERVAVALRYGIFNALLFFLVQVNPMPPLAMAMPAWNKAVVLLINLCLYIYFLYYFKHQTQAYQRHVEQQNRELAQLNLHNQKVMSVISHDMRAPIGNVYTSLMMLQDGQLSREEFETITGRLLQQVDNLQENINTLLDWGKQRLNASSAVLENIAADVLIADTLGFLAFQATAKQIRIDAPAETGSLVHADRHEISIVLRNLLSNAIKFSYPGTAIHISVREEEARIWISIQDKGVGMRPRQLAQVFDAAEPQTTYGTDNEKGNGLGLRLSREFAQRSGGDILLQPNADAGLTAILVLPAAQQ